MRHRITGICGERPADGHGSQSAVPGLPRSKGEQRRRGRDEILRSTMQDIGPEPTVVMMVRRIHPGPGVVADAEIGQQYREPAQVFNAVDAAACSVETDGTLNLFAARADGSQLGIAIPVRRGAVD